MRLFRVGLAQSKKPHWAIKEDDTYRLILGDPFDGSVKRSGEVWAEKKARLFAPLQPGKIVCVGRNYKKHAEELNHQVPSEPLLFLKPPTAITGPGSVIVRPPSSDLIHHEGELGVVLGRPLKNASPDEAMDAVFAYTCANDVTARDIQRREGKFTRAKGFDTFCPVGPCLVTADEITAPQDLEVVVRVDGEVRQRGNTRDMVFPIGQLLSFISEVMTLLPGDLVLTGTPEGVGPLEAGQEVSVEIQGIGALVNRVSQG